MRGKNLNIKNVGPLVWFMEVNPIYIIYISMDNFTRAEYERPLSPYLFCVKNGTFCSDLLCLIIPISLIKLKLDLNKILYF